MTDMTISQALRRSAHLKGQIAEIKTRVQGSVSHRVDCLPAWPFSSLMEKMHAASLELLDLEVRLDVTKAATSFEFDGTRILLVQGVRNLQALKGQIAWVKALPVRAQEKTVETEVEYNGDGHVRVQVPWMCHLPEAKRSDQVDGLQARFDALNDAVERVNNVTALARV